MDSQTNNSQELLEEVKDWRHLFPPSVLRTGEDFVTRGQYEDFEHNQREARAIIGKKYNIGRAVIRDAPTRYAEDWNPESFSCSCMNSRYPYGYGAVRRMCVHEAALMVLWERARGGPWHFRETPEEREERLREERIAREAEAELERREQQREQETPISADPVEFFPGDTPPGTYFDVREAVGTFRTNRFSVNRARELLDHAEIRMDPPKLSYGQDGRQHLLARADFREAIEDHVLEEYNAMVELSFQDLYRHGCRCPQHRVINRNGDLLCEHELALLTKVREYVARENPGDATDKAAEAFFQELDVAPAVPAELETPVRKSRTLLLAPRITVDEGEAKLSFKIGRPDSKQIILKNFREFLDAVEQGTGLALSKTLVLDFGKEDFTEESGPWLMFIQRRLSETDWANDRLQSRSYWGSSSPTLKVRFQDDLQGATLDRFYELAEGSQVEYTDKVRRYTGSIAVGHTDMRVRLSSSRIADARGKFLGISVEGTMPVILKGSAGSYILDPEHLSKITREEAQALRPFQAAANASGQIRFLVGKDKLAEFYYRVAPKLLESPYVDLDDPCAEEAEPLLPPEPAFLFRLDLEDGYCFCRVLVSYGSEEPMTLPRLQEFSGYRDGAQEDRVLKLVKQYFPKFHKESVRYRTKATDEEMYRLLTEAGPVLARYGEVQGSDAFRRIHARSMPTIQVGVSMDSGLLDISILTKDIPPAELLAVLESYRQKKTYHRLKSGDFVTLAGDEQLSSLEAVVEELHLTREDVLRGKVQLPAYRALYLDTMLEQHNALASSRDRTYRALVRNFRTIRDADYEAPAAQAEILRPYQLFGYKWLRTLYAAGFGGILADEMGLGKTLQTICLFQARKEEGESKPGLVVCPASLVFNWQEEFHRFAPGLSVLPVSGPAAARKGWLKEAGEGSGGVDVYITSYDLLRKDVALYEKLSFSTMVLDEAQYIKNQKAALTKAVKIIKADHRFALTGTPIENRLAELWSIFDFLMPGFLYGYPEFLRRFESPIAKGKDPEATEKLRKMTSPFILRRLKGDVLKDLPPKLEEVRYSRFEEEQRKIYDGQVVRMKQLLGTATQEDRIQIFAELMRIRQICCDPSLIFEDYSGGSAKRTACLELIESAVSGGHRMLVFSQFTSMLALLEEDLKAADIPFYEITGATPKEKRIRLVRDFNEGDTPVFLISLKAGGTGLNLTGADVVIHYDPWWNLAAQNQATDRAHRIGQTRQVTVYRMIVKDTIEEKILALQEAKKDLADAILSGESSSLFTLSNEELLELLS